jgi:hypothetical protein
MYYTDPKDTGTEYPNGSKAFRTPFPFLSLSKVKNCPVKDTQIRLTARITGQPNTFFSIPATIKYKKKNIAGFVTSNDEGFYFVPYQCGKNYHVIQP